MMGDGAAAARPHRQPSTQSTRSGPASAPRAPRASVIALPGPERRPGGRWLGACGRVAAWLAPAPPRGAALRGAARLGGLGLARLSGAWSGPRAPSPRRRRRPFPPVLAAPLYVPSPRCAASSHRRRKSGCSGNKEGAAARCGLLGWEGAGCAGRGARSGPPRAAPPSLPSLLSPPLSPTARRQPRRSGPWRAPSRARPRHPCGLASGPPAGKHLERPP